MTKTELLASTFADYLKARLEDWQWDEMRARNLTYGAACASHDFCDANDLMHDAFVDVVGHDPVAYALEGAGNGEMADADLTLWNDAWAMAKRLYLTAGLPATTSTSTSKE